MEASKKVIHPRAGSWRFAEEESRLNDDARSIPNWRLANVARKTLAALLHQLSDSLPSLGHLTVADLDADISRRVAAIQLAGLSVRSASAAMWLVGGGYEPEAAAPIRRLIEATLRLRAVLEDASGEHARQWLSGRPQGSAERLAQRYETAEELRLLSALAHADARALSTSTIPPGWILDHPDDAYLEVRPSRDIRRANLLLYAVGYETSSFLGSLAEAFGVVVEMPRWLSSELLRARDTPFPMSEGS